MKQLRSFQKRPIDERQRELVINHLQVGVDLIKRFPKPGVKKTSVYFGVVDLVYDKSNPDFENCRCHVTYDDGDDEDFLYSEFTTIKNFFIDRQ